MRTFNSIRIAVLAALFGRTLAGSPNHATSALVPMSAAPKLATMDPTGGPVAGGTMVTISGTSLNDVDSCVFKSSLGGSKVVPITNSISGTKIICTSAAIPSGNDDMVSLYVSSDNGVTLGAGQGSNLPFKYYDDPVIKRVLPLEGSKLGGEEIKIIGTGLANFDIMSPGNGKCDFSGASVPISSINPDGTVLTCKAPPASGEGLLGPVQVSVSLNGQNPVSGNPQNTSYHYIGTPKVKGESAAPANRTQPPLPTPEAPAAPEPLPTQTPLPVPNVTNNTEVPPSPAQELPPVTDDEDGKTQLTEMAPAGTKILKIRSAKGFFQGGTVQIDMGETNQEAGQILGFGSIILTDPLKVDHAAGALVVQTDKGTGLSAKDMEPLRGPLHWLFIIVFGCFSIFLVVGFILNRKAGYQGWSAIPVLSSIFGSQSEPINEAQ